MISDGSKSPLNCSSSTESFITPVSSVGDLMSLSPKRLHDGYKQNDMISDLLTGSDFEDLCDVTMHEVNEDVTADPYDFDYLDRCSESNKSTINIDRGKESLFIKFDPLYARHKDARKSHPNSNNAECDVGYETGSSASTIEHCIMSPKRTISTGSMLYNSNNSRPMQIVPPAINHTIGTMHPSQSRAVPTLVRSISAIMTPRQVDIDRLINITGNTPPVPPPPRSPQPPSSDHLFSLRVILKKQDQEIHKLRQENRELNYNLQDAERKMSRTTEDLEAKVKKLTDSKQSLLEEVQKLTEQVNEKASNNKQMSLVVEEYERTISWLIAERQKESQQHQESLENLAAERDEALNHLSVMETSFKDLLAKYEKCKSIIFENKEREKMLLDKIKGYEEGIKNYESLYEKVKEATAVSLSEANESLESLKKSHLAEIKKHVATIKKQEIMINSLQETLLQKDRENEQLSSICDEFINKV